MSCQSLIAGVTAHTIAYNTTACKDTPFHTHLGVKLYPLMHQKYLKLHRPLNLKRNYFLLIETVLRGGGYRRTPAQV